MCEKKKICSFYHAPTALLWTCEMAGPIYRANPPLWQMVIKIGLTMGVTMYLTKWIVKLMEPMIDPNYKHKQDAARARKSLMQRLGAGSAAHPQWAGAF